MKYFYFAVCSFLVWGCKKPSIPDGNDVPATLDFVLLDKQGSNLLLSTTTPIRVIGINRTVPLGAECAGGGCTMVRAAYNSSNAPKYAFYYSSLDASLASSSGVKTWYIELNGKVDTLYYDVQLTRPNDPLDKYDVKSIVFNGQAVQRDPDQLPLYVFRRKH